MPSIPDRDHDRALTLAAALIADVARDVAAWTRRGPNHVAAGRAALVALDVSIETLQRLRTELVPALLADSPEHRARQVDLADPGGIIEAGSGPGY